MSRDVGQLDEILEIPGVGHSWGSSGAVPTSPISTLVLRLDQHRQGNWNAQRNDPDVVAAHDSGTLQVGRSRPGVAANHQTRFSRQTPRPRSGSEIEGSAWELRQKRVAAGKGFRRISIGYHGVITITMFTSARDKWVIAIRGSPPLGRLVGAQVEVAKYIGRDNRAV